MESPPARSGSVDVLSDLRDLSFDDLLAVLRGGLVGVRVLPERVERMAVHAANPGEVDEVGPAHGGAG